MERESEGDYSMSDLDLEKSKERDSMDGGFAVVDRERLIEEEVRSITPWYKHFIHIFTAPMQMMEECLGIEPTKATSVGVIGCFVFSAIYSLLLLLNPINKLATYEGLRAKDTLETALEQTFSVLVISETIGSIIVVFFGAFISAILFQLVKVILRDRCKFATIYKMLLMMTTVTLAVQCLDAGISWMIGVDGNVFSIKYLLSDAMRQTALGSVLVNTVTLSGVIGIVYMVIGYKTITHTSLKKGIIATALIELVAIGFALLGASMTMAM